MKTHFAPSMSPLDALMPTHAAIAKLPAASPVAPAPAPGEPRILKYIILQDNNGHEHPVLFSQDIQHSNAVPRDFDGKPISAGFVMFHKGRPLIPLMPSESLNLWPRAQDKDILSSLINASK